MAVKLIAVTIPRQQLGRLHEALLDAGIPGMTIIPVRGVGNSMDVHGRNPALSAMAERVKCELCIDDDRLESLLDVILAALQHASPGGSGKIFVYEHVRAVRIRTGEQDAHAIS